jgi:hypothetical protein
MKKIFNIFLLILFITTTTGFTISRHYCGGQLVSIKINSEPKQCCDMGAEGCCQNETKIFKLKENFITTQLPSAIENYILDLIFFIQGPFKLATQNKISSIYLEKGFIPPPNLSTILVNLQSFRL